MAAYVELQRGRHVCWGHGYARLAQRASSSSRVERLAPAPVVLKFAAATEADSKAGKWADRLSINIEMPTETGLARLAPGSAVTRPVRASQAVKTPRQP